MIVFIDFLGLEHYFLQINIRILRCCFILMLNHYILICYEYIFYLIISALSAYCIIIDIKSIIGTQDNNIKFFMYMMTYCHYNFLDWIFIWFKYYTFRLSAGIIALVLFIIRCSLRRVFAFVLNLQILNLHVLSIMLP